MSNLLKVFNLSKKETPKPAKPPKGSPTVKMELILDAAPAKIQVVEGSSAQITFTAPENGDYRFVSSNNTMPVGAFSDSTVTRYIANHLSGEDNNFCFERPHTAGETVHFTVSSSTWGHGKIAEHCPRTTGKFDIIVRKVD